MDNQTKLLKSMQVLKEKMNKTINQVLPNGSPVYFFDYPVHGNVGDILIWKGTENFFKENDIKVIKRFSNHRVLRKLETGKKINIPQNTTIVCHGGGNFGDLYIPYQRLRKLLVENYPLHRIIFLPQTIYYQDQKKMELDFHLLSEHKDLHVLTRDETSFKIASKFLNNVYLCPDMAHSLYPMKSINPTQSKSLYLIREDKEIHSNQHMYYENINPTDWPLLFNKAEKAMTLGFISAHSSSKLNFILPSACLPKLWSWYSSYLTKKAVTLYNKNDVIITSRLHGHILACLMNKNSELIDNSYGKNSSYYDTWTHTVEITGMVKKPYLKQSN